MNKKPLIGVIPQIYPGSDNIVTRPGYMTEILESGGLPLLLPPTTEEEDLSQLIAMTDGLLLTGGQDVDPARYGEEKLPECGEPQDWRDAMEQLAVTVALKMNKPVFAICRGIQALNVALGGSLYQDIPTQYGREIIHSMEKPTNRHWHNVDLVEGSPIHELLQQKTIGVNSCHHQGIRRLGDGLEVMATAPDGIIEAVYLPDMPFVWGVQWHPELFYGADPNHRKLFEAFVEACRK